MNKALKQFKKRLSLARKTSPWYKYRKHYGQMVYVRFNHERGLFKEDGNERYIRCHGRCQGGMWYSLSLWRYD